MGDRRFRRDAEGHLHLVVLFDGVEGFDAAWTESCSGCFETVVPVRREGEVSRRRRVRRVRVHRQEQAARVRAAPAPAASEPEWDDRPLPEDAAIKAEHPTRTDRHDLYAEAMRLVGAKRSKGALVELVNWLLARAEAGGK